MDSLYFAPNKDVHNIPNQTYFKRIFLMFLNKVPVFIKRCDALSLNRKILNELWSTLYGPGARDPQNKLSIIKSYKC